MYTDLVFKGGGMKGVAFIGSIRCLEDYGYKFKRTAGTSAGAIIASLVAVGYSGRELEKIGYDLDYTLFSDKSFLQSIPYIGQVLSLFATKGIHKGDAIENFLSNLYKAKGKTKFKDVVVDGECRLKLIAADVTRKKLIILPDDLSFYGIDPMEFEIARAVRMSLSIPFYFNPVALKHNTCSNRCYSFIADGGLVSNFPIWVFDSNNSPRWPTFGFNLGSAPPDKCDTHNSKVFKLLPYAIDVVETFFSQNDISYLNDHNSIRIINIPTLGVGVTEFDLPKDKVAELYESGYKSAESFLYKWNFKNYISRYR